MATGLLAAVLLAVGVWWWIAFPIGGGLIPLAQGLAMRYDNDEVESGDRTHSKNFAPDTPAAS